MICAVQRMISQFVYPKSGLSRVKIEAQLYGRTGLFMVDDASNDAMKRPQRLGVGKWDRMHARIFILAYRLGDLLKNIRNCPTSRRRLISSSYWWFSNLDCSSTCSSNVSRNCRTHGDTKSILHDPDISSCVRVISVLSSLKPEISFRVIRVPDHPRSTSMRSSSHGR